MMLSVGCKTPITLTSYKELLQHPEFTAAAKAAPEFTRSTLKAVADWEYRAKKAELKAQ